MAKQQQVVSSGRYAGLEREFRPEEMENFRTGKLLKDNIKESSWPIFRKGLAMYCNYLGMDPDRIIEERKRTLKSDEEEIRRKHEQLYGGFMEVLKTLKSETNPRKKLASNTIHSRLVAIRSFYENAYYPLIKPKDWHAYREKNLHIPTPVELFKIIEAVEELRDKALIAAGAMSGISEGDLLSIRWTSQSDSWGDVKTQLRTGLLLGKTHYPLIHVHWVREKSDVVFDSFFGRYVTSLLKRPDYPRDSEFVYPVSVDHYQDIVHMTAKRVGIPGIVTPHCLRKFFSTRLKLTRVGDPAFNNDLIEYWQGHSLGRTRSAYLAPPPYEQLRLYLHAENRITPVEVEEIPDVPLEAKGSVR